MNWTAIRAAIAAWVRSGSGLDQQHVIWSQQGRPRPPGPYVEMRLRGPRALGQDWLEVAEVPLDFDDLAFTASAAANTLTATAHGLQTGDGPVRLTTTGTLPGGLATATDYWVIRSDANTVQLAATFLGAVETPTPIDLTSAGTGTHAIVATADTRRAGAELEYRARGTRALDLELQALTGPIGTAGAGARSHEPSATLEAVLAARRLPSVHDALVAAGVGVLRSEAIIALDGDLGMAVFEPRAVVTVHLHVASQVTESGTLIERAAVEGLDPSVVPEFEVDLADG